MDGLKKGFYDLKGIEGQNISTGWLLSKRRSRDNEYEFINYDGENTARQFATPKDNIIGKKEKILIIGNGAGFESYRSKDVGRREFISLRAEYKEAELIEDLKNKFKGLASIIGVR